MEESAFITLDTGGDLAIVAGSERYLLPRTAIRDLLSSGHDVPLLLPGGVIDAEATVSSYYDAVVFTLQGRTYTVRWSDFTEVARGDVQWAPLMAGRGVP